MTAEDNWNPKDAYTTLAASLEQPQKFAEIFCAAAKKQTDIHNVLKETFNELLQHDNKARAEIKGLLREIEKEDWSHFLKKIGGLGWAVILLVVGAILQALSRHYLQ